MKILVIGEPENIKECQEKLGDRHHYIFTADHYEAEKFVPGNDVIIDFSIDEDLHQFEIYTSQNTTVFLNTVKVSLAELAYMTTNNLNCQVFGFNGLPTFFSRPVLEMSLLKKEDEPGLKAICEKLNVDFRIVDDRVGLVTPRIICMIINEAYYTVQEGTATREDIDMAMKLGTNYPYGPFEWCERIGVKHVYDVLEAIYEDTRDERYKICSLLKKEYLQQHRGLK